MIRIDINCDVGEGVGNEKQLFPFISSCNIACGGHAGDPQSIRNIIQLARKFKVKIGAHPSYPDRKNFGRKSMSIEALVLIQSLRDQLQLFSSIMEEEEGSWHHIKPHGALYNDLAKSASLSETFLEAIDPFLKGLKLYVPFGSEIAEAAIEKAIPIAYEGFADRNYNSDLSLVSRSKTGAIISEPVMVLEHILRIIRNGKVKTIDGAEVDIVVDTFCIHGDTPSALQILTYLAKELPGEHIEIAK